MTMISLCRGLSRKVAVPVEMTHSDRPRADRLISACDCARLEAATWRGCGRRAAATAASLASSASAIRAAALTIAMVCGVSTACPPVMSITPRMVPESGSWTGTAAQFQRCTGRTKCSAEVMVTGASSRSAVPGALVPACPSSHCAPSTNRMDSAWRSTHGLPRTHSSWQRASVTAMTLSQSSAARPSTS
jgi:hypothetical protein